MAYEQQQLTRSKKVAEYVDQQRTRSKKVLKLREETKTETYPHISYQEQTKTKEVTYTVKVPETRVHRDTVTTQHQVAEDKIETYTARIAVPVVKEHQVKVQRMVPKVISVTVNPCASHSGSVQKGPVHRGHIQKGAVQKSASASVHDPVPPAPSL